MSVASMRSSFKLPSPLPGHPRLLAAEADWGRLRSQISSDPASLRIWQTVRHNVNLWDTSQEGQRWEIFRIGPDAHNILRFDNARQQVAVTPAFFTDFQASGSAPRSVLDLSQVYADKVASACRAITMVDNKAVLFQDEWLCGENGVQAAWQMLTRAEVEVSAGIVRLWEDGHHLSLEIQEPADAQIECVDVSAPVHPYDAENPRLKRIRVLTTTAPHACGRFRILAVPGSSGSLFLDKGISVCRKWRRSAGTVEKREYEKKPHH